MSDITTLRQRIANGITYFLGADRMSNKPPSRVNAVDIAHMYEFIRLVDAYLKQENAPPATPEPTNIFEYAERVINGQP